MTTTTPAQTRQQNKQPHAGHDEAQRDGTRCYWCNRDGVA